MRSAIFRPVHCRDCQYDLSGLEAGPCPECGRRFDPADPASFAAESGFEHRWRQVKIGATLAVLLAALVVWCGVTNEAGPMLLLLVAGVPGLLAFFGGIPLLRRPLSPRLVACSMIPAIVLVGAFYTLAIHMYLSLGVWPTLIGDSGFSSALKFHAEIAQCCFGGLFLILFVTWPIAVAVFAVVRRWHAGVHYLGMLALAWALGLGLMELGPDRFLYWWWD